MIKQILVAVDGSAHTKPAIECGIWLAKGLGARLSAVSVVDVVALEGSFMHDLSGSLGFEPFANFSSEMRKVLEENAKAVLKSCEEECEKAGLECETSFSTGIVSSEICEKGRVEDLIIVGRRGVNEQFEHGMLGNVTEGVIRKSEKPVLIVPGEFTPPEKPLLCYDTSPNAGKAMHSAAEFVKELSLPLTVLTVGNDKDEAASTLKEAEDYLEPYEVDASFVSVEGESTEAISRYYEEKGHDMVFMGTSPHHSRFMKMVLGSTTEYVMRSVDGLFFLEK